MTQELSISEKLLYSTVRICCLYQNNNKGIGTGFFFNMPTGDPQKSIPVIVKNKHVVRDSIEGNLLFTLKNKDGLPDNSKKSPWVIQNCLDAWIQHPDDEIDLCIMPIQPLIERMALQGESPFFAFIDISLIPTESEVLEFTAIEDVVMIGYPIGLWDEKNNLPLIRRGITATHPSFDFNGKKEFLIDAACFPGSSGSPVFLFNPSGHPTKTGYIIGPSRIKLLGIMYQGPIHNIDGKIEVVNIPTSEQYITKSGMPMNLGFVMRSELLIEFKPILEDMIDKQINEMPFFDSNTITTEDVVL